MKNSYVWMPLLLCCMTTASYGQIGTKDKVSDWEAVSVAYHKKGRWMTGGGLTLVGATVKVGRFVANRIWVGAEGDYNSFFADRREVGVFGRVYLWESSLVSGFVGAGASYGRFQAYNLFDIDGEMPPQPVYWSPKLSSLFGLEYPIGRRVSLEGVLKVGGITKTDWTQLSAQGSVNVYLGRK